ncbi:FecR domain-containing protein [Reichenbachiella sp. MALMAid0571]|uniref:FecR family protein n=1 Tax=Reichenbachiella sp. MALMAid0571 TaxID=3143939 RepID=UPI0032DE9163
MIEPKFSRIMAKVLSGEATMEEKVEIMEWANASEENNKLFKLSEIAWKEIKTKVKIDQSDAVFDNIQNTIDKKSKSGYETRMTGMLIKSGWRRAEYFAAAVVVLILAVSVVFYSQTDTTHEAVENNEQWVHKVNAKGEKLKVFLSDGTVVWLNGESSLSYRKPFSTNKRHVILSGEAYFDVAHDPQNPFSVKTGNVTTTALGTSFNIKAYSDEEFIDVDLETGKVLVSLSEPSNESQVFIEPGERIRYNKTDSKMVVSKFNPLHELCWKDGILSFENAHFEETIKKLSRWYGVKFEIRNGEKNKQEWSYTARFKNDYLSSILEGMSFTKKFDYTINNELVTITFR